MYVLLSSHVRPRIIRLAPFWACPTQVVRWVVPEQRRLIFLEAQEVNGETDKGGRGAMYGL